jgi:flagellin
MALVIKNNTSATNTLNQLNKNTKAKSKKLAELSSGMRINSAADDASGLSISEKMRVQIRSLDQDNMNTENGNSMLKVAEGAVNNTIELLRTMKEKLINAANDTNTDQDRETIQREFDQMCDQIDYNAEQTYNGKILLDGSNNNTVLEPGTYTTLVNTSFDQSTTYKTNIVDLKDHNGTSLGIMSSDTITVSYVKQGTAYVHSFPVVDDNGKKLQLGELLVEGNTRDLEVQKGKYLGLKNHRPVYDQTWVGKDQYGNDVYTTDHKNAICYVAKEPGLEGQISGLTISVTDRYGDFRSSANTILDNFQEVIRAQNPSPDNAIYFQTGTKSNRAVKVGLTDMRSYALGLKTTDGGYLNVGGQRKMSGYGRYDEKKISMIANSQQQANAAINVVETALQKALDQATEIGSVESRLGYTSANIMTARDNTQASESVIRDADMAASMTEYTKMNVLEQASQSMLAQANQNSSSVLSLLQ